MAVGSVIKSKETVPLLAKRMFVMAFDISSSPSALGEKRTAAGVLVFVRLWYRS